MLKSCEVFLSRTPKVFFICQKRCKTTFFTTKTAEKLWDSASPTRIRTGRGKRAKVKKRVDLGSKHILGEGEAGMVWPGLNVNIKDSKRYQRTEEEQAEFLRKKEEKEKLRIRPKREKVMGWTGAHWGGVFIDPTPNDPFEGFRTLILEQQRVSHMTGRQGRVYSKKAQVVVGNGNGVIGVGAATSSDFVSAVRKAKTKAEKRLQLIERFEERTVFEDLYVNHHHTYMYIRQQPKGYGLRCHRAVADICKIVGIKDLYVKTFGSTTMLNLTKCFMKGLTNQETHQQKADRLGYHVVEYDELRNGYPRVLASPKNGTNSEEFDEMESYLNQDLLIREFKNVEGLRNDIWSRAQITNNRGMPVPPCQVIPEDITSIKKYRISKESEI